MKKGPVCPHCKRQLIWDGYSENWICLKHGDVTPELQKVKAGMYR